MRRLPPLTAIEAFVQVARLGSVKAAAEELALSSPALTRRVQTLERFLGRALFERRHQSIKLNAEGERLLQQIAPSIDALSDAIEAMTSGPDILRLRLGVLPLFASQRLFPHLAALRQRHPNLHIDVDTAAHSVSRLGDGLDAAITLAREVDPALYAKRLDRNMVYAIASTRLTQGVRAITRPEQLEEHTVMLHRDMPDTFDSWRGANGLRRLEPAGVDYYDSGQLKLEAAAQGLGVAFMHESHYTDAHDERLVRLFDFAVESPYSYWFACRPRALATRPVQIFHDWLVELFA